MHHCEHHRNIGSGKRLNEVISRLRSEGTDRVDHDDSCSGPSGFFDEGPEMPVRQAGVGSPQQDVSGIPNVHGIGSERAPQCQSRPCRCRRATERIDLSR